MSKLLPKIKLLNERSIKIHPEIGFKLQFDGCSKGNPGLSGSGSVLYYNDCEIWSQSNFVGSKHTNNQAEYNGLLVGLKKAIELEIKSLVVEGDSLLVINQMKGVFKCNSINLFEFYNEAKTLLQNFDSISFNHIYRNQNERADKLANEAVNKYLDKYVDKYADK